jgi:hypothetical protein
MDDEERERLLTRVNRQSATVGASLPETITVEGEQLPLAEFVMETRELDRIPPETNERLEAAKRTLREERSRRVDRLESEPMDRETGEELADKIIGIDRALNALENVRKPRYGEQEASATVADAKRWVSFLDQIR